MRSCRMDLDFLILVNCRKEEFDIKQNFSWTGGLFKLLIINPTGIYMLYQGFMDTNPRCLYP